MNEQTKHPETIGEPGSESESERKTDAVERFRTLQKNHAKLRRQFHRLQAMIKKRSEVDSSKAQAAYEKQLDALLARFEAEGIKLAALPKKYPELI